MLSETVKIKVNGKEMELHSGTTLLELSKMLPKGKRAPVIARVGNSFRELTEEIYDGEELEFIDLTDSTGNKVYLNGLIILINYVFDQLYKGKNICKVKHSADSGLCFETTHKITKDDVKIIEEEMRKTVELNLPITKITVLKHEAIDYFKKMNDEKKVNLLEYYPNTYVHLYKIGNMYHQRFTKMPAETSVLDEFKLTYLDDDEFILQYPTVYINDRIKEYKHHEKLFEVFRQEKEWAKMMKVETCADLNRVVSNGKINDLIRMSETLSNNRLLEIAKTIEKKSSELKVVLLSGPSSSGKTTTCCKLAMYLRSLGLTPKMISMDDFFKERVDTPKKPNGEYDFECLEAVDLKLFNDTIKGLLDGKEVLMPTFDFYVGEKKFKKKMILEKTDVLLIEGIHALNPKLLTNVDGSHKFKIYLSPLTGVNVDKDNRVSTTDNRLMRRMIRDARTRGYSVSDTLSSWKNVREGEEKNIFPYQDEADVVFNTSLVYEMCILKTYVLPLLFAVTPDDENYGEANRLMKLLNLFLPIPSEAIPDDSIVREFIGGGCFLE